MGTSDGLQCDPALAEGTFFCGGRCLGSLSFQLVQRLYDHKYHKGSVLSVLLSRPTIFDYKQMPPKMQEKMRKKRLAKPDQQRYTMVHKVSLRGWVQFPTGGDV